MKDTEHKKHRAERAVEIYPETNQPLTRPQIHMVRAMLFVTITLVADIVCTFTLLYILSRFAWYTDLAVGFGWQFAIVFGIVCCMSVLMFAKKIVIFIIRLYQRYASYDIRSQCLFVPNCSEYMVLAIKKYGLVSGIKKGIDRYHRCHAPNGGEDYP